LSRGTKQESFDKIQIIPVIILLIDEIGNLLIKDRWALQSSPKMQKGTLDRIVEPLLRFGWAAFIYDYLSKNSRCSSGRYSRYALSPQACQLILQWNQKKMPELPN
jgi:hypothetical protein